MLGFLLGDVHSMGLDKCVMTCIHHYSVIQNNFIALNPKTHSVLYQLVPSPEIFFKDKHFISTFFNTLFLFIQLHWALVVAH